MALARPAAQHAGQRAHRVGTTDPPQRFFRPSDQRRTGRSAPSSAATSSSPASACPLMPAERIHVALEVIDMLEIQIHPGSSADLRLRRATPRPAAGTDDPSSRWASSPRSSRSASLGTCPGCTLSRQAVQMAGIDIGVRRSDRTSRLGKLTPQQGSAELHGRCYEAAQSACRPASPNADYHALKARGLSHTRASLTIAHKLAQPLLPPASRELGPRRPGPDQQLTPGVCFLSAHHSTMCTHLRPAPEAIEAPTPQRGGPPKTEQPESLHRNDQINHHVTGSHDRQPRAQIRQGVQEQPESHQPDRTR